MKYVSIIAMSLALAGATTATAGNLGAAEEKKQIILPAEGSMGSGAIIAAGIGALLLIGLADGSSSSSSSSGADS